MKKLFVLFIFAVARLIISLRYRIKVEGLEKLTPEYLTRKGGIIFLPNHPAEMDPVMLMLLLYKKFQPRPLVVEHFYYLAGIGFFMDLVRAIPLPNLTGSTNKWKVRQIEKLLVQVEEELKRGENFLIYPAGRLKLNKEEILGGASFIHHILSACPEANVVMVRTSGLWGSMFSRALTGKVPSFGKTLFNGMKIVIKNGIFFTPRREVKVQISPAPADFPYDKSKLELNRYLENWFNTPPDEVKLVSYYFWKEAYPEIQDMKKEKEDFSNASIPEPIKKAVLDQVAKLTGKPAPEIKKEMRLALDLGMDSLDLAELSVFLDHHFEIRDLAPEEIETVQDLLLVAAGIKKPEEKEQEISEKQVSKWLSENKRGQIELPEGMTVQESFLLACERMCSSIACADTLSGAITYRKMKIAALILSAKIKEIPGDHIGVLLPSSVGAYVVILAVLLANKVPVMLNWTVGTLSLDHACELTQLKAVLSSYRFLSRLENGDLGKLEEQLVFLEEIKRKISFKDKIRALLLSFKSPQKLLKKLKVDARENDPAVILFTSGTETLPKGVALTHLNILSNQRAALSCVDFESNDTLYGILPPFHSFGFSVTGLLPILSGMRVLYAPNPTDSHALAHDIETWKPTFFCAAPSFMAALFRVADPQQLKSIRLYVSGAEKTPQELFDRVASFGADKMLLEGYGITECSPIVTIDRPGLEHRGVGKPVPGVELIVINSETQRILPQGEEGEICIHGLNVFSGYLGGMASPFFMIEGKQWYRTADRGYIDTEGFLILGGRLKRFVKMGGEMVSLGGIEDVLLKTAQEKNISSKEGPPLAVSAKEKESDRPEIVVFATFDISKDEVNTILKQRGFGRIAKVSEVRKIEQIPLTGAGKTNYRLLDELCTKKKQD